MTNSKTLGLVCASLLGAFGANAALAADDADIRGQYVDQATAARQGGVGGYVDTHQSNTAQKLEARREHSGTGRYVDQDTAKAMGGVGGYVSQEDYDAYQRQQAGKAANSLGPESITISDAFYFAPGSSTLKKSSKQRISDIVAEIPADSQQTIVLNGFADNTGSNSANKKLSQQRANAVRDELVLNGISEGRIEIRPFGAGHPVAQNSSSEGRAQNRRVELEIS